MARASRASSRRMPAAAHARSTSGRCAAAHSLTHAASGASHAQLGAQRGAAAGGERLGGDLVRVRVRVTSRVRV